MYNYVLNTLYTTYILTMSIPIEFINQKKQEYENKSVQASQLYIEYVNWCSANNSIPLTSTKFGILMSKDFHKLRTQIGWYYNLSIPVSSPLIYGDHKDFLIQNNNNQQIIKASQLYTQYVDWCRINNKTVLTSTKFGALISNEYSKIRKSDGHYYDLSNIRV